MNTSSTIVVAGIAAAMVVAQPAEAQSFLLPSTPEQGVWVEVARPHFTEGDPSFATSAWYLGGRLPINQQFRIIVDVPFAHAGFEFDGAGSESNTVLGNPYLGVEYLAVPGLTLEGGVRAPLTTADEESFADLVGFLAEPQKGEAFLEDFVPVTVAASYEQSVIENLTLRGRGGFTSAIYTGDVDDMETMTFFDYGVFSTYSAGLARVGLGISGRWDVSADEGGFSDNSFHQLGITADAMIGGVRPGLSFRVPLEKENRELVDYTIGAYLQVPLR